MNSTSIGSSSTIQQPARGRVGMALVLVAAAAAVFGANAVTRQAPVAAPAIVATAPVAATTDGVDTTEFYRQHYGAVTPAESVAAYDR